MKKFASSFFCILVVFIFTQFSFAAVIGTLKWRFDTKGAIFSSPAVGKDGTVYIGDMDGYLYAVKTNEELAKSAWPKFRHDNFNSGSMLTGK